MMRAKADPKATSNTLFGIACLLMLGSIVGLLWPKPNAKTAETKARTETRKDQTSIQSLKAAGATAQAAVLSRTWAGEDAAITGAILNLTTTLSTKRGVNFVRLQPQRLTVNGNLEQLPYLLVVEGPFPAVAALEKDLEVPANRLAVNAFQLSSSDSETNKVSATIAVVAQRVAQDAGTTTTTASEKKVGRRS